MKTLIPFLKTAVFWKIEENLYLDYLKDFINKENFFCLLEFCKTVQLQKLNKYLMYLLQYNFVMFSKTNGFKAIEYKTLQKIISNSGLNVSCEIEVFEAMVGWIEHDEESRKHLTCDLLKIVRLQLLSPEILKSFVKNHKLCRSCQACCEHIETVLALKTKPNNHASESLQNRSCTNDFPTFLVDKTHMVSLKTEEVFKITSEQLYHPLELNRFVFFSNAEDYTNLYSSETEQWVEICPPDNEFDHPDPLINFTLCLFMGKLYVTGGWRVNSQTVSDICHAYDPSADDWKALRCIEMNRVHHACVAFAGKIVVTGGIPQTEYSAEAYDHYANEWTFLPDLMEAKDCHGSVALGNKLYVIAASKAKSSEVFDYVSDKFTLIKPFPLRNDYINYLKFEYFRVKDEIVVKYDGDIKGDNVYVYNPIENKWSSECVELFKDYSVIFLRF